MSTCGVHRGTMANGDKYYPIFKPAPVSPTISP